jgi:hypothetical protein
MFQQTSAALIVVGILAVIAGIPARKVVSRAA